MNERTRWSPTTPADLAEVKRELEDVLAASPFVNSKRYPAFLRFVVEKTLAGKADELKERTLGVEIFHRAPDYDSNNDTIVRVTAGEVRRRLTDFYHRAGADHSVQISVPLGSYVPDFFRTDRQALKTEVATAGNPALERSHAPTVDHPRRFRRAPMMTSMTLAAAAVLLIWWRLAPLNTIDSFWRDLGSTTVILSQGRSLPQVRLPWCGMATARMTASGFQWKATLLSRASLEH